MVNRIVTTLLDGLFPHYCELCGARSGVSLPLCPGCQWDLRSNDSCCYRCAIPLPATGAATAVRLCGSCLVKPPPFQRVIAPWLYCEQLAQLIQRWKFHGETRLTPLLAALWLQRVGRPEPPDLIVPVPLHWRRLWQRGFNQSELLSRQLRRACEPLATTELAPRALRRKHATLAQSGMSAPQRTANIRGAFTVERPCGNLRVAVIDDVLTTGATASAAAGALLAAGASEVEVWCLARTPAPGQP